MSLRLVWLAVGSLALSGCAREVVGVAAEYGGAPARTTLASIVSRIPIASPVSPYKPVATGPASNSTTIFNLNDDVFRYDLPKTAASVRKDDYEALQALAKWLNGKHFAARTYIVIEGTLNLNRLVITAGTKNDTAAFPANMRGADIYIQNASNFEIVGKNAKILVKGDFNRPADTVLAPSKDGTATVYKSGSRQVTPFYFFGCSNFRLTGIEIDGNVDKMTKDNSATVRVSEGGSAGVKTSGCKNYKLENLFIHHMATDGITVGSNFGERVKDGNGVMIEDMIDSGGQVTNVVCSNNDRQGLTVSQTNGLTVKNSWLCLTGVSEGTYGMHAPGAGVDIEPNYGGNSSVQFYTRVEKPGVAPTKTLTTEKLDAGTVKHTHNILFDGVVLWANEGVQFIATPGTVTESGAKNVYTSDITVQNCQIFEAVRADSKGAVALVSDRAKFNKNKLDVSGDVFLGGVDTLADSNVIETRKNGLSSIAFDGSVTMSNNTITASLPMVPTQSIPVITRSCVAFVNNKINYPLYEPQYYPSSAGIMQLTPVSVLQGVANISGNVFTLKKKNAADPGPRFIIRSSGSTSGNIATANTFPTGANVDIK